MALNLSVLAQSSGTRQSGCLQCHTTDVPTKANPSLKQCPRAEMVSVRASANSGPDKLILNKIKGGSDLYEAVEFSHKAHAQMSEMSAGTCVTCHHYNPPGRVLGCSECHVSQLAQNADLSKPGLKGAYHRQCINCHKESGLAATRCEECHAAKGSVAIAAGSGGKPEADVKAKRPSRIVIESAYEDAKTVTFYHDDHVDRFRLTCSTCHANEKCSECHRPAGLSAQPVAHVKGGHDRCSSCHSVDENCNRCHDKEAKLRFNHARESRFDLGRFHSTLGCVSCHKSTSDYKGLSRNCVSCHSKWGVGSFKHQVTGLTLDETHKEIDCESCHEGKDFAKKPTCVACHEDKKYPDAVPGTKKQVTRMKRS
jgi:hypothetical protein